MSLKLARIKSFKAPYPEDREVVLMLHNKVYVFTTTVGTQTDPEVFFMNGKPARAVQPFRVVPKQPKRAAQPRLREDEEGEASAEWGRQEPSPSPPWEQRAVQEPGTSSAAPWDRQEASAWGQGEAPPAWEDPESLNAWEQSEAIAADAAAVAASAVAVAASAAAVAASAAAASAAAAPWAQREVQVTPVPWSQPEVQESQAPWVRREMPAHQEALEWEQPPVEEGSEPEQDREPEAPAEPEAGPAPELAQEVAAGPPWQKRQVLQSQQTQTELHQLHRQMLLLVEEKKAASATSVSE